MEELKQEIRIKKNNVQTQEEINKLIEMFNKDLRCNSDKLSIVETQDKIAKYLLVYRIVLYTALLAISIMNVSLIPLTAIVAFLNEAKTRYMVGTKQGRKNKIEHYKNSIENLQRGLDKLYKKINNLETEKTAENLTETTFEVLTEEKKETVIKPINHEFDDKGEVLKRTLSKPSHE